MGGSSGVLLAIFFAAAGDAASSGLPVSQTLQAGLQRMQEIGGANQGDRTLVDALAPALDELGNGLETAAKAARKGADHTATLASARAGRASYLSAGPLEGHAEPRRGGRGAVA